MLLTYCIWTEWSCTGCCNVFCCSKDVFIEPYYLFLCQK